MNEIEILLKSARYSKRYKGFYQLANALELVIADESRLCSLMNIYREIAEKHGVNLKCVEKNIRTANEYAWKHGGQDFINEISGENLSVEPETGELLEIFLDYLLTDKQSEN